MILVYSTCWSLPNECPKWTLDAFQAELNGNRSWWDASEWMGLWHPTLKDKIHEGGLWPPTCFGTSCASGVNGVMWRCRGVIDKHGTDEKAAEKCFHVPATSLEALSAIRWRCQDMEAIFSSFHIGSVGVRVVGGWRGGWFGRLAVLQGIGGGWCGARASGTKKPCKLMFTGHGQGRGGARGWPWPLVWPFGGVTDVYGRRRRFVMPGYTRMKKKPNKSLIYRSSFCCKRSPCCLEYS